MTLKIREFYSPNFNIIPRKKRSIKFVIFHYTGMKSEKAALNRLTKIQSQDSAHYFIKKNGNILRMVPDLYVAWHAGFSQWGNDKLLNKSSIGIEISNPGHLNGYINFSKKQVQSIIKLTKSLIPRHLNVQIWKYLLESYASEQAARMVAMENATDNAEDMIKTDMTMIFFRFK